MKKKYGQLPATGGEAADKAKGKLTGQVPGEEAAGVDKAKEGKSRSAEERTGMIPLTSMLFFLVGSLEDASDLCCWSCPTSPPSTPCPLHPPMTTLLVGRRGGLGPNEGSRPGR